MAAPQGFDPLSIPVTYTPITGRISKAKKGKKVHVCEFGCGKVFTRAEHRKRHEANHNKEPLYKCHVGDCQKPFQRLDLLNRHLDRQHGIQAPPSEGKGRRNSSAQSSVASASVAGSPGPAELIPRSQQTPSPSNSGMSAASKSPLTSVGFMEARKRRGYSQSNGQWIESQSQPTSMPIAPRSYTPDYAMAGPLTPTRYGQFYPASVPSSPFANQQGFMMEGQTPYNKPTNPYPAGFQQPVPTVPSMSGPEETGMNYANAGFEGFLDVGGAYPIPGKTDQHNTPVWIQGVDPVGDINMPMQNWAQSTCHVDPLFPIIHRTTFEGKEKGELLAAAVLAAGSKFSTRPSATRHSQLLLENARSRCVKLGAMSATSEPPLEQLQATFLLEYISLFRSGLPGVHGSAAFAAMYANLTAKRSTLELNLNVAKLAADKDNFKRNVEQAHAKFVNIESRRRLLSSSFVLDTHRKTFFEKPSLLPNPLPAEAAPLPCDAAAWSAKDAFAWFGCVSKLPTESASQQTQFDRSLKHAQSLQDYGTVSAELKPDLQSSALQMSTHAPVRHILNTVDSTCVYAQRVSDEIRSDSRDKVRDWLAMKDSNDAAIAAWLASKVLRSFFAAQGQWTGGLATDWCLYLAALVLWTYARRAGDLETKASPPARSNKRQRTSSDSDTSLSAPESPVWTGAPPTPPSQPREQSSSSFLAMFDTPMWQQVVPLRGCGRAHPVLRIVRDALSGSGGRLSSSIPGKGVKRKRGGGGGSSGGGGGGSDEVNETMAQKGVLIDEGCRILGRLIEDGEEREKSGGSRLQHSSHQHHHQHHHHVQHSSHQHQHQHQRHGSGFLHRSNV